MSFQTIEIVMATTIWQNILIEIMFMVEKVNKFRGAAKLDDNQFNDKQF